MSPYKVLIVDDDPDDREIMNEAFLMQGSTHHLILSSAKEMFLYLQGVVEDKDLPLLIISDLRMPVTSGLELMQTLKGIQRYQHIDVLLYSTSSISTHLEKCLALGAKEYFTKPSSMIGYEEFAKRISSCI
ncbi:MAG TPA: response regulator [Flavisolibacter sp.]|nr:response regulator [Flavisolibacter sp.]